jgi:uncharacterized protein (DUF3084 family)
VFTLTATSQELSALIAAARPALEVMESDPRAPREALELLGRVVRDYDSALARLQKGGRAPGVPVRGLAEEFLGAPDASPRMPTYTGAAVCDRMCSAIWSNSRANSS